MVGIGEGFFIETVSDTASRILHPVKVLGTKENGFVAEVEEANVSIEEGAEFQIYFEVKNKFVKQAAKITAVYEHDSKRSVPVGACQVSDSVISVTR